MASALGSLVVKLALEYAQYTQGLNKSEQDALKFAKNVQAAMDKAQKVTSEFLGSVVTGALGAVASYQTVTAVLDGVKASIDRLDNISKTSQRVGIAAETLQELAYAGDLSDVSLESLATSAKKLSVFMLEAAGGGKDQAAIFKALGIEVKNADGSIRDTTDVMGDLADQFAALEDGPVKTALAVKVFGKAGADLIPLLNGGKKAFQDSAEEARKFGLVVGGDVAKQAEAFNDNLTRLGKITEGTFNQISTSVLPVLVEFSNAMVAAASDTESVNGEAQRLAKNGTLFEWAKSVAIGFTYIMDGAEGVVRVIKAVGLSVGALVASNVVAISGIGEAMSRVLKGDFSGALGALKGTAVQVGTVVGELGTDLGKTFGDQLIGDKIRGRLENLKQFGAAVEDAGKKSKGSAALIGALADSAGKAKKEIDENAVALQKWTDQIQQYNNSLDAQAEQTEKLTKAEEWLAQLTANSTSETQKLTDSQRAALAVELQLTVSKEKRNKALADEAKWLAESAAENQKAADSLRQQTGNYTDELKALQLRRAMLGLTAEQVAALEAAELRELAAQRDRQAATADDIDFTGKLGDEYRRQAANLRAIANEKQQLASDQTFLDAQKKEAEELQRLNDQIGEGFASSMIEGGKSWFEYMKSLLRAQVFAPLFKNMLAPLSSTLSSVFSGIGSVIGGGGAGGGSSAPGKGFDLGSIFDTLSNGLSDSISNAFARFSSSGFGAQLGLSTPTADLTGALSNLPSQFASSLGKVLGAGGNAFAGYGLSKGISGGYSVTGGNALNNIGAVASLYFGPIAGVVTGAINRVFGRKLADSGIEGTFGGAAGFEGSSTQFYKGGLFRSNKTEKTALGADFTDPLADAVSAVRGQVAAYATALGLPVESLQSYTEAIKFSTKDLSPEQIQAKLQEALGQFGEGLADTLAGSVDPFKKAGETTTAALQRLGGSLAGVNPILEQLGLQLFDISAAGGDAASQLAELFGGLDGLGAAASTYYANFYSEAERAGQATDAVTKALAAVGLQMPATREEFRALVEAQDRTTDSGREAFATLLSVSGAFADLVPAADEAVKAVEGMSDALRSAIQSNIGKFETPDQTTARQYGAIASNLGAVGINITAEQLIGLTKQQVLDLATSFVNATDASDEAKVAVVEAAGALADLKDGAAAAAAEAEKTAAALRAQIGSALDGVVDQFLSGAELATFRANRIAERLNLSGFSGITGEAVLGIDKRGIAEAWQAVGDEGKAAILEVYDSWVQLQEGIAQSNIDEFLAGLGVSADELMSAYREINPAADTLVDSWRKTKGEVEELSSALAEIDGTQAVSALDALRATLAKRDALSGVIDANNATIFDTQVARADPAAVDLLKQREADLWRQFASTSDPEVAKAITATTLQRIKLEGDIEQRALQEQYQAQYDVDLAAYELQQKANADRVDALNEEIDSAKRLQELAESVGTFVGGLRAGSLSNLSYTGRLDQQKQLFETSLTTGVDAQGQLQAYLQQAQQLYGGATAEYSAIFDEAVAKYEAAVAAGAADAAGTISNDEAQLEALRGVAPTLQTAIVDTSQRTIDALGLINDGMGGSLNGLIEQANTQRDLLDKQLAVQQKQLESLEVQITQAGDGYSALLRSLDALHESLDRIATDGSLAASAP